MCAGQHVEQLHRYLGQQGYMKARRKVSRYYDEATAEAVAAWQQDHGVVPSGSFGHESRQAYLMQLVRVVCTRRFASPVWLQTFSLALIAMLSSWCDLIHQWLDHMTHKQSLWQAV